nr:hypothetical protein [Archangium violaceum]
MSATEWASPAARAMMLVRPATCTGTLLPVVIPLPSSPFPLVPQALTVPSFFNASTW